MRPVSRLASALALPAAAAVVLGVPGLSSATLTEIGVVPQISAEAPETNPTREPTPNEKKNPTAKTPTTPEKGEKAPGKTTAPGAPGEKGKTGPTVTSPIVPGTEPTEEAAKAIPTEQKPSCPEPKCLAVSRTTGFQVKVGSHRNLDMVPHKGSIVAWSIQLGKPTATQIKYFDKNEGGEASAGIAILEPQKTPNLTYKLIAQSPVEELKPYFGHWAQFPLEQSIEVKKGDLIGLTVPTWAPSLALNYANTTSWRASRGKTQCSSTNTQTAQSEPGQITQYYCLYATARLTYKADLVSTP